MPEPQIISVSSAKLLMQKLLIAFVIGFVPIFLAGITTALQGIIDALSTGGPVDFSFLKVIALSVASGAVTTFARACLALIPGLNLTATDKLHQIGSPPPVEVRAMKAP